MGFPGDLDPEDTDEDITEDDFTEDEEDLDNEDDFEEDADDIDDVDTCPICARRNNHNVGSDCAHLIGVNLEGSIEDCRAYDLFVPLFNRLIELGTRLEDEGFHEPFLLALTKKLASLEVQPAHIELFTPLNEDLDSAFFALGHIQEGEPLSTYGSFSSGIRTNLYSEIATELEEKVGEFDTLISELEAECLFTPDEDDNDDDNCNVFLVDSQGTICTAGEERRVTREDAYNLEASDLTTPVSLAEEMERLAPLRGMISVLYYADRKKFEKRLERALRRVPIVNIEVVRLRSQLEGHPDDVELGWKDWLISMSQRRYSREVYPLLEAWFSEEPDLVWEDDYIDQRVYPQGAAMAFFEDLGRETCRRIGVVIVEGLYPGSTYYAAELRIDIGEANARAEDAGLNLRFIRTNE